MTMDFANRIISRLLAVGHRLAAMVVASLILVSCADGSLRDAEPTDPKAGYITIDLSSSSLRSRAPEADVDNLNENLISKALICLFPDVAYGESDKPAMMQTVDINQRTEATVQIRIYDDLIGKLFPAGISTARAYVIANLPASTVVPSDPTLAELRALPIEADFASSGPQPSFVMDGEAPITLTADPNDPSRSYVTGEIRLTRVAAKLTLGVSVAETVTDGNDVVWESRPADMSVLISNGVNRSEVKPMHYTPAPDDYFSTATNAPVESHRERKFTNRGGNYPFVLNSPFYTYPNSWTADGDNMTYMTLVVPWKKQNEESYRTCYYTVPVLRDAQALVSNVSYRVNINVNILGSSSPDDPLQLDDLSYRAVEWGREEVGVDIEDYRYLVLDATDYVANNEALVNIPFYSSHETTITDTKVTYYLYNTTAAGLEEPVTITDAQNSRSTTTLNDSTQHIYSSWINNKIDSVTATRTLLFHHPLYQWDPRTSTGGVVYLGLNANDEYPTTTLQTRLNQINYYVRTENIAFSRYEIEITLVHKDKIGQPDEANFTETIKITQYPQMYIETQKNFYGGTSRTERTAARGNMYDNGNQNGNTQNWYVAYGLGGDAGNANPNQYVISITSFNDDRYSIGDPRVTAINNLNNNFNGNAPANGWATAPGIENANTDSPTSTRKLSYYYPTDQSNAMQYRVAPQIRIASSYGVCYNLSYEQAQRRCASYQELQYPAGRWRIPTFGEIEYIINLSATNKIPVLFNSGGRYWSAQGRIIATTTDGKLSAPSGFDTDNGWNNNSTAVRCVYDEWFWGDDVIKTTQTQTFDNETFPLYPFVWGDRQQ